MMRRGPIALLNLTFLMVHIVAMSDPLGDPNFIPGTGHGELTRPVLPEVTLRIAVLEQGLYNSGLAKYWDVER